MVKPDVYRWCNHSYDSHPVFFSMNTTFYLRTMKQVVSLLMTPCVPAWWFQITLHVTTNLHLPPFWVPSGPRPKNWNQIGAPKSAVLSSGTMVPAKGWSPRDQRYDLHTATCEISWVKNLMLIFVQLRFCNENTQKHTLISNNLIVLSQTNCCANGILPFSSHPSASQMVVKPSSWRRRLSLENLWNHQWQSIATPTKRREKQWTLDSHKITTIFMNICVCIYIYNMYVWVADKITYYLQWTWPKWVVLYWLWRFVCVKIGYREVGGPLSVVKVLHKFDIPSPLATTYYYFSLPIILSVTHLLICMYIYIYMRERERSRSIHTRVGATPCLKFLATSSAASQVRPSLMAMLGACGQQRRSVLSGFKGGKNVGLINWLINRFLNHGLISWVKDSTCCSWVFFLQSKKWMENVGGVPT